MMPTFTNDFCRENAPQTEKQQSEIKKTCLLQWGEKGLCAFATTDVFYTAGRFGYHFHE